jgi:hypothetical protein
MIKLYQLRRPDDRLNGWWVLYCTREENFVTWAFLEKKHADLPEYMRKFLSQDNDFPVILKRRKDAELIMEALSNHVQPKLHQNQVTFTMPQGFDAQEAAA